MRLHNCSLKEIKERFQGKKIVFFGCGSWLKQINYTEFDELKKQFGYIIDNKIQSIETCNVCEKELKIYYPSIIENEKECIIVLTSPVYQYDMFCQLSNMNLSDGIECYSFPFMILATEDVCNIELLENVRKKKEEHIPRIIHGFWFSGEDKGELYKKCYNSWNRISDSYQIVEWNMDNYDWQKHPFLKRAIELKAWAFATDYARLDVIEQYGGIYMDMDVEVIGEFDNLLGNDMILAYANHSVVDLAFFAAKPHNQLVKKLMNLYDDILIPDTKEGFVKYHQPSFVRKCLAESGVDMNGQLQVIDENTVVFPKDFFMVQDHILFREPVISKNTYTIHYDNFGWSYSGEDKRRKKIEDNRRLWEMIT